MNKTFCVMVTAISSVALSTAFAMRCPDPNNSSLQWGQPPVPWVTNPLSPNPPQGEDNAQFVRANILVAGVGRGVSCTYRISTGDYSIWFQALVKIPSRVDPFWIDSYNGKVCTQSIESCEFTVAN